MTRLLSFLLILFASSGYAAVLRGVVTDDHAHPLGWANVIIEGTTRGTTTGDDGAFYIPDAPEGEHTLGISLVGYETIRRAISLSAADTLTLELSLSTKPITVGEVQVTTDRDYSGISPDHPVRTEVLGRTELRENSDDGSVMSALGGETGLKTRPCAMCGSAGVGMQGLDPSYTEVNVDGMPVLSGLGTLYGLEGLAASDVSRVELVKGSSSSEYGSGAMTGAVNLISAKPGEKRSLDLRAQGSHYGQYSLSATASGPVVRLPMQLSVWQAGEPERLDLDHDGVTDAPNYHRTNLSLRMTIPAAGGEWNLASRLYREHRFAGDVSWTEADRGSADVYGRDILTAREEYTGQYSRTSGGWRTSFETAHIRHRQDSWYGTTEFDARQFLALAKLSATRTWSERHESLSELSYSHHDYRDNLRLNIPTDALWNIPGVMVQHTWTPTDRWRMQGGVRTESYEDDGVIALPRASASWEPVKRTVLRIAGGMGYRPVSIFSLEEVVHAGFENVVLDENLQPERNRSLSLGVNQTWLSRLMTASLDLSAFYTHFDQKVIVSFGDHRGETVFRNAERAFSRGVELQARFNHVNGVALTLGGSRSQVRYDDGMAWRNAEMQFAYAADGALTKTWATSGWKAEVSANVFGPQYLPEGRGRDKSPPYVMWDARVAKTWNRFELSLAARNLFDWTQSDNPYPRDPVTGRLEPDAALSYGPLMGRVLHLGMAYSL
ncbi:MAG: TonB-dependent receptor [bacterium]|nr:TonB-dependent receptor [bacterium]